MAQGDDLKAIVETVKELGPIGWFMFGAGTILTGVKRGWLVFGEKLDLAVKLANAERDVAYLTKELAERDALIKDLRSSSHSH